MRGSMGWGPESHQLVSQTSFEKQLDSRGPIASQEGSALKFLRKPIATYDFLGGVGVQTPCPPSGSAHVSDQTLNLH